MIEQKYIVNDDVFRVLRCIMCDREVVFPYDPWDGMRIRDRFHEPCRQRYLSGKDSWRDIKNGPVVATTRSPLGWDGQP